MNDILTTLKHLGPTRLVIMGGVFVGLLLFFVFISMRVSSPEMKLLYSELSSIDSNAITAKLDEAQIPYETSSDGAQIMVTGEAIGQARMMLAQEGLPNGGSMGYELFDQKSGFGTTNFVQNINQVRALEGELARTIGSLEQIRNARVHLVLPQRELFSRENREASASVFVTLRPGADLNREQIVAIQSLVASGVPQLKTDSVSLIDSNGNLLARGGDENQSMLTMKAEELRLNYERRMTSTVENLIGRIVGYDRVRANVAVDLNFDRISTNEELYDPETQVLRSSQLVEENNTEREPPSSEVSVQNNLPGISGDLLGGDKPAVESNRVEEISNFEISKTIRNVVREVGEIKKLSIAVLVDGNYTEAEDGTKTYEPRTQQELDQIADLVKSAVGYDENRGDTLEVVNMKFATIDMGEDIPDENQLFGFEKSDLLDAAEIITVAIMVILVILLVIQPMVARILASEEAPEEDIETELLTGRTNPALAGPKLGPEGEYSVGIADGDEDSMIDMQQVEGKVRASSVKRVEDIVETYPSETVSVLRSWMSQDS